MTCTMNFITRSYMKVIGPPRRKLLTSSSGGKLVNEVKESKILSSSSLPQASQTQICTRLKESSIPFEEGYTCYQMKGCLCSGAKKISDQYFVFVNKKTGFFVCNECQIAGDWFSFNGLFDKKCTSEKKTNKNECYSIGKEPSWNFIKDNTELISGLPVEKQEKIFHEFNLVPCTKKKLQELQLRISTQEDIIYFPIHSSNNDVVGYKTLDKNLLSNTTPKQDCPGFLSFKTKKKSQTAVLVGNVADFIALVSKSIPYDILCLPYGSSILPQSALPYLESYEKLILWLGESGGLNSTVSFVKKLNNKRCYVIRPVNNQSSVVVAVNHKEDIVNILKNAKPAYNEFIITFNHLREDVLAELQNKELVMGVPWKRFPGLNKILKGHRRGELTVLTGPTGSGKTTFMSEYSLDLAMQGVNTLWGSFEIRNARLARTMLQQYCRIPLQDNLEEFEYWADKFEELPIYFMTFHGQQSLTAVMDTIEHCLYTQDIAHVIIDNVQFMIEVLPQMGHIDRFWKQDHLIQTFRSFATVNNCHVTLVMHPRKGYDGLDLNINSIFGGAKAAQEADNVLIIQESVTPLKKYLQVSKNRFTGDLGKIPLKFDKSIFSFYKNPSGTFENDKKDLEKLSRSSRPSRPSRYAEDDDDDDVYDKEESGFDEEEENESLRSSDKLEEFPPKFRYEEVQPTR